MSGSLLRDLHAELADGRISTDEAARELAGSDLFPAEGHAVPDLVIRPRTITEISASLRILAAHRVAVVPRGAGLSYTGGVVPDRACAALDLTGLDHVTVHASDLSAVVGAGCTWERLGQALQPHGLRAVLSGPISGSHSTIGGAASQNVPGRMEGITGLRVALADGSVVCTGSLATAEAPPFWRYRGPDLTGLFLGDCGAFGVKAEVALRLEEVPPCAFVSFAFTDSTPLFQSLLPLLRRGQVARALAMDRARAEGASRGSLTDNLRSAAGIARGAGSLGQAVRELASLPRARAELEQAPWSLHLTLEAATQRAAEEQADAVRAACRAHGTEIEPVVPKALRARPFSVRGFVGPEGERWVPVHGILALSRAAACMAELEAHLAARSAELTGKRIRTNWLVSSSGPYLTIEPMFYWRDRLDPLHHAYLSPRNRARFGEFAPDPAARASVRALRTELRDIMDRHGAAHAQIGRFYRLDDSGRALLSRIKGALDPAGHMNPGALGLPENLP